MRSPAACAIACIENPSLTDEFDDSLVRSLPITGASERYARMSNILRDLRNEIKRDIPTHVEKIIYERLKEVIMLEASRGNDWSLDIMCWYGSLEAIRESLSYTFSGESSVRVADVVEKMTKYVGTERKRATIYRYAGD